MKASTSSTCRQSALGRLVRGCVAFGCVALVAGACVTADESSPPRHCATLINQRADCFVGTTFADCPGPAMPRAYCHEVSEYSHGIGEAGCLWVSNGCPLDDYVHPLLDDCGGPGWSGLQHAMMTARHNFGLHPWTRDRGMVLDARFAVATTNTQTVLSCHCPTGCHASMLCNPYPGANPAYLERSAADTLALRLIDGQLMGGTYLDVEIDAERSRARACWHRYYDSINCSVRDDGEPDCAVSGTIELDQARTALDVKTVHGKLAAMFGDGTTIELGF